MWFTLSFIWFWLIQLPLHHHSESSYFVPHWKAKPSSHFPALRHEQSETCAIKIDDDSHGYHRAKYDTFENHPCRRECIKGRPIVCRYKMVTHHYHSMGPECKRCWCDPKTCAAERCIPFDGTATNLVVVNHQYPSPTIELCLYDTIVVELYNNLTDPTIMHWHGFHMSETPESDGSPLVTQNLIPPGETHNLCFKIDRPGTVWYHSHAGWQRAEGIVGPIVVRIPREDNPHQYLYDCDDREHVVLIHDVVYNGEFKRPQNLLINGRGRKQDITIPDDDPGHRYERLYVVWGKCYRMRFISNGIFNCPVEVSIANHAMTIIAVDGNDIEPMKANKFHVTSGERIDIVLCANQQVNTYWINFKGMFDCDSIQQYGVLHYKGAPVHQIPQVLVPVPSTGRTATSMEQEGDVIVNAIAEYGDPCIMQQSMAIDMGQQGDGMPIKEVENQVKYETVPGVARKVTHGKRNLCEKHLHDIKPVHGKALSDNVAEFKDHKFHSLGRSNALNLTSSTVSTVGLRSARPVDLNGHTMCKTYYLSLGILEAQGEVAYQIDDITFVPPTMSLLQSNDLYRDDDYFCNRTSMKEANINCRTTNCKCTNVVRIPACECIEFVVVNLMCSTHPFHLHGYTFRVIAQQTVGNVTILRNIEDYDRHGLIQRLPWDYPAVEKDVVQVPGLGVAVLRFQSVNTGYWMAHCHIERHTLSGMKLVVKVGENNQIKKTISRSKCLDYNCHR